MKLVGLHRYPNVVRPAGGRIGEYHGSAQRKFSLVSGRYPCHDLPAPHQILSLGEADSIEIVFGAKGPGDARVKARVWRATRWMEGRTAGREVDLVFLASVEFVLSDRARGAHSRKKLQEEFATVATEHGQRSEGVTFDDELFAGFIEWAPSMEERDEQTESGPSLSYHERYGSRTEVILSNPEDAHTSNAAARVHVPRWWGAPWIVIEFEVPESCDYAFALIEAVAG